MSHNYKFPQICCYCCPINKSFPNLFQHTYKQVMNDTVEASLEIAAALSCNLYMLLEYVDYNGLHVTDAILVDTLCKIRKERTWGTIHPQFIDSLNRLSPEFKQLLKENTDITSSTDSVCTFAEPEEITNKFEFVTRSALYEFHMKLPGQSACDIESECGFVVEVNGLSRENEFDIKLTQLIMRSIL